MDVRIAFLLISSLIFSACGNAGRFNQAFHEPTQQCADAASTSRFLIKEKMGNLRVEQITRAELEKKYDDETKLENIESIEPDYKISVRETSLHALDNETTGANDGNWGIKSINISGAWNAGVFGQNILVGVIDSGMDLNHPQLRNRLAGNVEELSGLAGMDDDHNGYIDDKVSWNFGSESPDVTDPLGHGTHVAGIIAAEHGANTSDPKGVAPSSTLLPISFIDASGSGYISNAIRAIDYARARGVNVINASWGGGGCSSILQQKIEGLKSAGIIFVAASGNAGYNIDHILEYPASLNLTNQITVGSVEPNFDMSVFSNYGSVNVHLLAPGANIYSTFPGGYRAMSGTSMATPFVTGAVALLKGAFPQADFNLIKAAILSSVNDGNYPVKSRGRLNIGAAYTYLQNH